MTINKQQGLFSFYLRHTLIPQLLKHSILLTNNGLNNKVSLVFSFLSQATLTQQLSNSQETQQQLQLLFKKEKSTNQTKLKNVNSPSCTIASPETLVYKRVGEV